MLYVLLHLCLRIINIYNNNNCKIKSKSNNEGKSLIIKYVVMIR